MKLNRNFVQISATAIVTSAVFILYIILSQSKGPTVAFMKSERITWEKAQALKKEYLDFKPLRVKHKGESGTEPEKKQDLEGFVFEVSDLREIIETNHSSHGNPDKVIFYFGQEGTWGEGLGNITKRANMHIIAIGMQGKTLLNDGVKSDATRAAASIFDKADPCPPNCPTP